MFCLENEHRPMEKKNVNLYLICLNIETTHYLTALKSHKNISYNLYKHGYKVSILGLLPFKSCNIVI